MATLGVASAVAAIVAAVVAAAVGASSACSPSPPAASAEAGRRPLHVFAASSLREPFTALASTFERVHPEVAVVFNFAGSQELRAQIEHGAAADVVALADTTPLAELARAGRVEQPVLFASNEVVVVVAREAADRVRSFADLPSARRIVVGTLQVPIGRYTTQVLDRASARLDAGFRARVEARVVSYELNVKQVLAKVRMGEADAGIVYRSDVHAVTAAVVERDVVVVPVPPEFGVPADYPIAIVVDASQPSLAQAWRDAVLSAEGQQALLQAGFLLPTAR